ncbi:tetratricopeptide repeat protein [Chitinophaga pinensis]|uniref:Tetratricopeptide repeat protein n=1 Tax=Chitinophaga pinensis (strain ATCC 43595 / DSM 2588 / LMG 13176 / NBRC 15968 / NCIMB 11800 / UQM 2034) TaxID=485918 RepID=A0A979FZQ0_CHIPD|nr:hypothetical protein [Chitinophaga pinensis]ACU58092.1 hypothetical protein Cpin_0594 [Chitinophaga pinensis DSM 2588]
MREYSGHFNTNSGGCSTCFDPNFEPGYPVRLCKSCRKRMSRYPVKKEVRWAAIGVGVILIIALFRLPAYFTAGIGYMKGIKAAEQRKYLTAEKAFADILQRFPDHKATAVHMATAAYYNDDVTKIDSLLALLDLAEISLYGDALSEELLMLTDNARYYNIQDKAFDIHLDGLADDTAAYRNALETYLQEHPYDYAAAIMLSNHYYELHDYAAVETICAKINSKTPSFRPAWFQRLSALKQQGKYKEAYQLTAQLLTQNTESIDALSSLATFQLKLKMDAAALKTIQRAHTLAPDNKTLLPMLCIAYHFNQRQADADKVFALLKNDPVQDSSELTALHNIITDKAPFRE